MPTLLRWRRSVDFLLTMIIVFCITLKSFTANRVRKYAPREDFTRQVLRELFADLRDNWSTDCRRCYIEIPSWYSWLFFILVTVISLHRRIVRDFRSLLRTYVDTRILPVEDTELSFRRLSFDSFYVLEDCFGKALSLCKFCQDSFDMSVSSSDPQWWRFNRSLLFFNE